MESSIDRILAGHFIIWDFVAMAGMLTFGTRFLVQWIVSEVKKESTIPVVFWYLSIVGSLLNLSYAYFYLEDLWMTLAFLPNCIVYTRNLMLIEKKKKQIKETE
jgi:lipid-A-disaccharide synthase-like uncharacterized protein